MTTFIFDAELIDNFDCMADYVKLAGNVENLPVNYVEKSLSLNEVKKKMIKKNGKYYICIYHILNSYYNSLIFTNNSWGIKKNLNYIKLRNDKIILKYDDDSKQILPVCINIYQNIIKYNNIYFLSFVNYPKLFITIYLTLKEIKINGCRVFPKYIFYKILQVNKLIVSKFEFREINFSREKFIFD